MKFRRLKLRMETDRIRTNGGDVDLPLRVAGDAPPSGGVVHSYAWGIRVELKVGDWGRRSSYRGLFGLSGAQLSFRRDRRRYVLYDFVLLRSGGLRWWSSNRMLPSRDGLGLGLTGARRSRSRRGFRYARLPWLGRNGRRSFHTRRQCRLGALGLLFSPG